MTKLSLQVGKKYRSRSGEVVTITGYNKDDYFPFQDSCGLNYNEDGGFLSSREHECDLIEEVTEEKTKTVKFEGPSPDDEVQLEFTTDKGPYEAHFAPAQGINMPSPTAQELNSQLFLTIWEVIKRWDIGAPEYYGGYTGASGSHAVLISRAVTDLIDKKILK